VSELGKFASNAVVILIGWGVVHYLSARRDLVKARKDLIVKCTEGVEAAANDLLSKAISYHINARDLPLERDIKVSIQDMAQRLAALDKICTDTSIRQRCSGRIIALRQAITGSHFEDEHAAPVSESDPKIQDIAQRVSEFKRSLLELRYKQFELK
jgi:hypothetical protein